MGALVEAPFVGDLGDIWDRDILFFMFLFFLFIRFFMLMLIPVLMPIFLELIELRFFFLNVGLTVGAIVGGDDGEILSVGGDDGEILGDELGLLEMLGLPDGD